MQQITVSEFVNVEHKAYGVVNSIRSIPFLIDGLKPSQRKILFSALEYNKSEIVDRLALIAAARTNYKSAGDNLSGAVANMARAFSGTNNVPYFDRDGQFGSIVEPEPASVRYISVTVSDIIKKIFRKEDNDILDYNYLVDEQLEPKMYLPVLPMALINGISGIGSGYATKIPNHSVESIIAALRALLKGEDMPPIVPQWTGYKGETFYGDDGRVNVVGKFERLNATTIKITEVPIGFYSKSYETKFVLPLYKEGLIIDYSNDTAEEGWDITITFKRGELSKLTDDKIIDMFGLKKAWLPVLVGWNEKGFIKRYDNVNEILHMFFEYRLSRYEDRRQSMLAKMQAQIERLEMRSMFIQFMTAQDMNQSIDTLKRLFLGEVKVPVDVDELFKISLSSITLDAKERLAREINRLKGTRHALLKKTSADLYNEDLDEIEAAL